MKPSVALSGVLVAARGWAFPMLVLLAIVVPFVAFGSVLEGGTAALTKSHSFVWPAIMILLLAVDVLLPIPASVVAVASVLTLGPLGGALVIFAGMTIGCLIGYLIGVRGGARLSRTLSDEHHGRLMDFVRKWGRTSLVLMRPLPVLAEASVLLVASTGLSLGSFLMAVVPANAAVALVYGYATTWIDYGFGGAGLFAAVVGSGAIVFLLRRIPYNRFWGGRSELSGTAQERAGRMPF